MLRFMSRPAPSAAAHARPAKKLKRATHKKLIQKRLKPLANEIKEKPPRPQVLPVRPREFLSSYLKPYDATEINQDALDLTSLFWGLPKELRALIQEDMELDLYVTSKTRAIFLPLRYKCRWIHLVPHESMERTRQETGYGAPWYKRYHISDDAQYRNKPQPFMVQHADDPEVIFSLIMRYGAKKFEYASERLRDSTYLFTLALHKSPVAYKYGSLRLRGIKKYYDFATSKSSEPYRFASLAIRKDKKRLLAVVNKHDAHHLFKYAPQTIQNDEDIAALCIAKRPQLIAHMRYTKDDNWPVLQRAIMINGAVVLHIRDLPFRENQDLYMECFQRAPEVIQRIALCAPKLITQKMALQAITWNKDHMMHVPSKMRGFKNLYTPFLKAGGCLRYVAPHIQNEREKMHAFKMGAENCGYNLRFIRFALREKHKHNDIKGNSSPACCEERNKFILLHIKVCAEKKVREKSLMTFLKYWGCGKSLPRVNKKAQNKTPYDLWMERHRLKKHVRCLTSCYFCNHGEVCHCPSGHWTPERIMSYYTRCKFAKKKAKFFK